MRYLDRLKNRMNVEPEKPKPARPPPPVPKISIGRLAAAQNDIRLPEAATVMSGSV